MSESLRDKQQDVKNMMDSALESEGLRPDPIPAVFREEMEGKRRIDITPVGDIKEQEELDRRRAFNKGTGGAGEGEDLPKPRERE